MMLEINLIYQRYRHNAAEALKRRDFQCYRYWKHLAEDVKWVFGEMK